jgi:hypothetical protein
MKTTKFMFFGLFVLMTLILTACAAPAAPTAAPLPTQPPPTAVVEVPTQEAAPTEAPEPTQAFAPVCQSTAASCAAPDVRDTVASETYCVKKIPYTNVVVDAGTTFEVLDKSGDFSCADSGQKTSEGKMILTCTGKELFAFDLKLANPACSASTLVTGTGQCQDGFGFDAAQGCCAPVTSDTDAGSVTIRVNLGGCPLPQ